MFARVLGAFVLLAAVTLAGKAMAEGDVVATSALDLPIALLDSVVRVPLAPVSAKTLADRLRETQGRNFFLEIYGLRANAQPGIVFLVYLGLPAGETPGANDPHLVGTINYFGALPLDGAGDSGAAAPHYRFDVTDQVTAMVGRPGTDVAVTIVAAGMSTTGSAPRLGRIALVAE